MALTGQLAVGLSLRETASADSGLQSAFNDIAANFPAWTIANGTAAGQATKVFADTRTLAASTPEDLDLSGALTNLLGTVVFTTIKAIFVYAAAANTNSVQVTRTVTTGVNTPFMADGDGVSLSPGAMFLWASPTTGGAVTNSTDDTLTVTNSAGSTSVDYTIIIIGT